MPRDHKLAWLDLEATGSSPMQDYLLEAALVVTDIDLEVLGSINVVINPAPGGNGPDWQARMNDKVREMHTRNGLIADVPNGMSLRDAEDVLMETLQRFGKRLDFRIAGSGVQTYDRKMLDASMRALVSWFQIPSMDTSNIRSFLRDIAKRPDLVPPLPGGRKAHRAMDDILQHLDEARWYRELVGQLPLVD